MTTWGNEPLTDKGKFYLTPFLPITHPTISINRQKLYCSPKIIISKIGLRCEAFYDQKGVFASINTNCIHSFDESYNPGYVLCWINSKLFNYVFECLFDGLRMSVGYLLYSAPNLLNTCIKRATREQQLQFVPLAYFMQTKNQELLDFKALFLKLLSSKFPDLSLGSKLRNWSSLVFKEFVKELEKQKIKFSLSEQSEWMQYFESEKAKANAIQDQISKTDREIDAMVYELYGLTEEEIRIVEGG